MNARREYYDVYYVSSSARVDCQSKICRAKEHGKFLAETADFLIAHFSVHTLRKECLVVLLFIIRYNHIVKEL